ncbi:hypothetical protein JST97_09115 [bacterium]|nr:hypothetical protein [bacterium]
MDAGRITVNLEQALAMTAHLTFPDRDGWVLKFVQAAVAARASQIHLSFEDDRWLLRHDGASVGKLSLLDALGREGPRKQMALCLRAAWQDPAVRVVLTTSHQGRVSSLTWPGDGAWQGGVECPWGTGDGTWLSCDWRTPQTLTPQRISRFRAVMRLSPVPIWLRRDCINDGLEGDRRVPGWIWPTLEWDPRGLALAPANVRLLLGDEARPVDSSELDWRHLQPEIRAVPAGAFMSLTPEVGTHQLRLVHFGVELEGIRESLPGATTGLVSVISTTGLVLDATGCKPVEDAAFQARREQLNRAYQALLKHFQATAAHTNIVRLFKGY